MFKEMLLHPLPTKCPSTLTPLVLSMHALGYVSIIYSCFIFLVVGSCQDVEDSKEEVGCFERIGDMDEVQTLFSSSFDRG